MGIIFGRTCLDLFQYNFWQLFAGPNASTCVIAVILLPFIEAIVACSSVAYGPVAPSVSPLSKLPLPAAPLPMALVPPVCPRPRS